MDIRSYNVALVNRSGTKIPVYSTTVSSQIHTGGLTAGGSVLGHIWPNEFYTLVAQDDYTTCRKIYFRNGSGNLSTGYIETSPGSSLGDYAWVQYQEPFHRYCVSVSGTSLAGAGTYGGTYYCHGLRRSVRLIDPNGNYVGTLAAGLIIAAKSSTCGETYPTYMRFDKVSYDGGKTYLATTKYGYGFVDMQISSGTMPNVRSIL